MKLLKSSGKTERWFYLGHIKPAAFDVQTILKESLRILQLPRSYQSQQWKDAFITSRSWGTLKPEDLEIGNYPPLVSGYKSAVQQIDRELKLAHVTISPLIAHAQEIGMNKRPETFFPEIRPLLNDIQEPQQKLRGKHTKSGFTDRNTRRSKSSVFTKRSTDRTLL